MSRASVIGILRDFRGQVERSTEVVHTTWSSRAEALQAIDDVAGLVESGPNGPGAVRALVAPTGDLQELAIANGWGDAFLVLAARLERAIEATEN